MVTCCWSRNTNLNPYRSSNSSIGQITRNLSPRKPHAHWNLGKSASYRRQNLVQILTKPFAGIYGIVNLVTGDKYINSASKGNIGTRFNRHLYGGSGSPLVWTAVQKYGLLNFAFILLEKCLALALMKIMQTC